MGTRSPTNSRRCPDAPACYCWQRWASLHYCSSGRAWWTPTSRQTDWTERDLALILTALLAGLRSEELRLADIGDIRITDNRAATIHVRGKGGKERSVPIEAEPLSVIEAYLDSRAIRFPGGTKRKTGDSTSALSRWPARSPLFVGSPPTSPTSLT